MRIVARLLVLLPLLWVKGAWAVDCTSRSYDPDSGYSLEPPGCDRIPGSFRQTNDSVTNVDYLANITSIGGYLFISGDALTNLDGLASLTSVGGHMYLVMNKALTSIDGLASLSSVGDFLRIDQNSVLTNLDGLASLTSVGSYLLINGNNRLTNLDGLASLTSVGGGDRSERQGVIPTLIPDRNARGVVGQGDVYISDNRYLTNLDGLVNLTSIPGYLTIERNYDLANCGGVALLLGWPSGPPADNVGRTITIRDNETGCDSVEEVLASGPFQVPSVPIITSTEYGDGKIILTASVSDNGGTDITGYEATCTDGTTAHTGTSTSSPITVSGLTNGVAYTCTVTASNSAGTSIASAATDPITPISPPAAPSITSIEAGDGFAHVNVSTYAEGGADITAISAECTFDDLVYTGESVTSPVLVSGLMNGRTYECTARATNLNGTSPASASASITLAQTMPLQPIIFRTDSGDGELTLFVSESSQSTTVDSYKAACRNGTNTYTANSTSSAITVSGLTNGAAYTCTVTATNSVGTSSASAATAPITPEEITTGLPVWLLYQATQ